MKRVIRSSTEAKPIKCTVGTPEQFIEAIQDHLDVLQGERDIESATNTSDVTVAPAPQKIDEGDEIYSAKETLTDGYLDVLVSAVSLELENDVDDVSATADESNIYLTVTLDGKIDEFVVPITDLSLEDTDEDSEYISKNVRDLLEDTSADVEEIDDEILLEEEEDLI